MIFMGVCCTRVYISLFVRFSFVFLLDLSVLFLLIGWMLLF